MKIIPVKTGKEQPVSCYYVIIELDDGRRIVVTEEKGELYIRPNDTKTKLVTRHPSMTIRVE